MQFGTSLGAQWLRLRVPSIGVVGSIPGQGTTIPFTPSPPPPPPKKKMQFGDKNTLKHRVQGRWKVKD